MKHSTERILTTHVGSLVRPPAVLEIIHAHKEGEPYSTEERATIDREVAQAVAMQAECGIDIPSDGEYSKSSFSAYVQDRLTGFETKPPSPGRRLFDRGRDRKKFREAYEEIDGASPADVGVVVCSGADQLSRRGQSARRPCGV